MVSQQQVLSVCCSNTHVRVCVGVVSRGVRVRACVFTTSHTVAAPVRAEHHACGDESARLHWQHGGHNAPACLRAQQDGHCVSIHPSQPTCSPPPLVPSLSLFVWPRIRASTACCFVWPGRFLCMRVGDSTLSSSFLSQACCAVRVAGYCTGWQPPGNGANPNAPVQQAPLSVVCRITSAYMCVYAHARLLPDT